MYFKNDPREGINHMTEGSCTNKTTQHKIDQKTLPIMEKKKDSTVHTCVDGRCENRVVRVGQPYLCRVKWVGGRSYSLNCGITFDKPYQL